MPLWEKALAALIQWRRGGDRLFSLIVGPLTPAARRGAAGAHPHTAQPQEGDRDGVGGHGFWAAWFGVMCTMAGTGILQLPYTLKQGGWVCVVMIVAVAALTNYTAKLVIKALYWGASAEHRHLQLHDNDAEGLETPAVVSAARLAGYPEIGRAAFGTAGVVVVHLFHKATLFGVSTLFLILSSKFLMEGLGGAGEGLVASIGDDEAVWQQRWTAISAGLVLLPVLAFRTLGEIAPLSALGMTASVATVVVVVVVSLKVMPVTSKSNATDALPLPFGFTASNRTSPGHTTVDTASLPSAFSAIILSFGGHAVFPSLEAGLERRSSFPAVLNAAFSALVFVYLLTAAVGYAAFGDQVYSPILCNLPRKGPLGRLTAVTKLLVAFHVLTAYPILMNVLVREIEVGLRMERSSWSAVEQLAAGTAHRAVWVALTTVVALYVPYFPEFMTLVGAICLTMIVFVLPVVFGWKLRTRAANPKAGGGGATMPLWDKALAVLIIAVAAVGGAIGAVQAVQGIVTKLGDGAHE